MLDQGFSKSKSNAAGKRGGENGFAVCGPASIVVEEWKDCEELRPKPKEKWVFMEKKSENTRHRTEWCAEADKYRCMRCGRGSK